MENVPALEDVSEVLEKIHSTESFSARADVKKRTQKCELNEKLPSDNTPKNKKQFGGMKSGFLASYKVSNLKVKSSGSKTETLSFVKSKHIKSPLVIEEVQQAMMEGDPMKEFNNVMTNKVDKNEKVSKVLNDPAWLPILDEFQKDPLKAQIKYKDDKEVRETMQELCSILGDSFLNYQQSSSSTSEDEFLSKKMMEEPKLKEAMSDPFIMELMSLMKKNQNDRVTRHLQMASPSDKIKVQTMVDFGLFSFIS